MSAGSFIAIVILSAAVATIALANMERDKDVMAVCQIDHSYDVCFQALNR